jgi:hypothetical protein
MKRIVSMLYGEDAILPKLSFVNVSKWSSDTIKGAAIKFYQHTHLPLASFPISF